MNAGYGQTARKMLGERWSGHKLVTAPTLSLYRKDTTQNMHCMSCSWAGLSTLPHNWKGKEAPAGAVPGLVFGSGPHHMHSPLFHCRRCRAQTGAPCGKSTAWSPRQHGLITMGRAVIVLPSMNVTQNMCGFFWWNKCALCLLCYHLRMLP